MDEVIPDLDEPRVRPAGVTIVAVLAILFGLLGTCCLPVNMVFLFMAGNDPKYAAAVGGNVFFMAALYFVFWIISILLTSIGFGLWGLKSWARMAAIIYCVVYALLGTVGGVINAIFYAQKSAEVLPPNWQFSAESYRVVVLYVSPACTCFMILIHIAIAVYLTRPNVKVAFRRVG